MKNALEIRNLSKAYTDFTLDNINLTLPSGCIMGFVGENGAGKSTTIKLILDLIHRDGGEIAVLGEDHISQNKEMKENIAPQMGCDIADAYLNAELGSGYEWWHNFYEFHKLAIDELEAFDYEAYKKNGFRMEHLGDYPLTLETKPED